MQVAVTGASGFVGANLVRSLRESGVATVAVSRRRVAGGPWRPSPTLDEGDNRDAWALAFEGCSAVVHSAAQAHARLHDIEDAAMVMRTNCDGAVNALHGAATAGVTRFIFLSTIKVLGEQTNGRAPFNHTDTPAPADAYARSKAAAETALSEAARDSGISLVVLRLPLVYGPGVGGNMGALLRLVARGVPLPFAWAGTHRRSLLSTANLASAIEAALTVQMDSLEMRLMLSDGQDISIRELIENLAAAANVQPRLFPVPLTLMRFLAMSLGKTSVSDRLLNDLRVDIRDTRVKLRWTPRTSVAQGMKCMLTRVDGGI